MLRLPILGAELPVSRLELNGQSVPISESLVRQENSATVIRQLPSGNSEVKLFFRPEVTAEASFTNDLGADSLDTVELIMEFEKEFYIQIPDDQAENIATVGQAISYIEEAK